MLDLNKALIDAIKDENSEEVQNLLDKGAEVNAKDDDDITALMYAADCENDKIAELLISKGADINAKDNDGMTALMECEHNKIVELFINKGADINAKNNDGWTALMFAVESGNKELADYLISNGADIQIKDNEDMTALMHSANFGVKEIAEILIKNGASLNAKDNEGMTPLMYAIDSGEDDIAELIINKGADVNAKDNDGLTVLMHAAKNGDKEIAEILIKKGAGLSAKDNKGETALDIAKRNKYSGIPELLERPQSKTNIFSINNHSNAVNKLINGEKGWRTVYENVSGKWPEGTYDFIAGCLLFVIGFPIFIFISLPENFFVKNGSNEVWNFMNGGFVPLGIAAIITLVSLIFLLKKIITLYLDAKSESKVYRGEVDDISVYTYRGTAYILKTGKFKWRVNKVIYSKVHKEDSIIMEYKPYTPILLKLMVKHHS